MDRYVDKYFEKNLNNQTKSHIYLNDIKIATVNNNNNPYYILSDHLSSSSILIDSTGTTAQLSDYKPFGEIVYNNTITDLKNDYKHTGKEADEENNLQYYGARYYDNKLGKFISVEPVMLVLYDGNKVKSMSGQELKKILSDPQTLNTYAYSRNNPVILVDIDGNWWKELITGKQSLSSFQVELGQAANQLYNDSGTARAAMDHPGYAGAAIGIGSGLIAKGAAAIAINSVAGTAAETIFSTCLFNCGNILKFGNYSTQLTGQYSTAYFNRLNSQFAEFANKGINIGEHALNSMNKKGFTPDQVINALNQGQKYLDKNYNNINFIMDGVRVSFDAIANKVINVLNISDIDPTRFIKQ